MFACFNQELERERFAAKCTMLQKKNTEMGKRITELEEVIILIIFAERASLVTVAVMTELGQNLVLKINLVPLPTNGTTTIIVR